MVDLPNRKRPPEWLPRGVAITLAVVLAAIVILWILYQLRSILYILFLSVFVAIALEPAVQSLVKRGWKRRTATLVVFLLSLILFAGFIGSLVPVLVTQASNLIERVPEYLASLSNFTERFGIDLDTPDLGEGFQDLGSLIEEYGSQVAGGVLAVGNTVVGLIFQLATVALFSYYLLAEGPTWRRLLLSTLPPKRQQYVLDTWETAVERTGRYAYSRALLAVVATIFTWVVLLVLQVPSAFPLAIWMGVLSQFIPVIGTYIGMVLPALAALSVSPLTALWVVIAMIVYQQLENYVIAPRVTSKTMDIHPAVSIGAVIAGASLLGGVGAILALPVTAIVQALVSSALARHDVIEAFEDEAKTV
ncbi:MAG TPA: AI-2E family transporter [Acidimicrobiia bacterium]|nr:AI-2E family transporter [Acidimicrobiia bacterium]